MMTSVRFLSVLFIVPIVMLYGCASETIFLEQPHLRVSDVDSSGASGNLRPGTYLSFRFNVDNSLEKSVGSPTLLQIQFEFRKNEEIVATGIAFGPYAVDDEQNVIWPYSANEQELIAFAFADLEYYSLEDGTSHPLNTIDFDNIVFRLKLPNMGFGAGLKSEDVTFHRDDVFKAINASPIHLEQKVTSYNR